MKRLTYEESCIRLQPDYLGEGVIPKMPKTIPRYDDTEMGLRFFRTFIGEGDNLSNLTLSRTFISRCEINDAIFVNTDFSQSNMCWNDFIDVDFSRADLSFVDMRASVFKNINFIGTDLQDTDFRHSFFDNCIFENANMQGTILTPIQGSLLSLSQLQKDKINWADNDDVEPDGG